MRRTELAEMLFEAINLLVELESYLADPNPRERQRVTTELLPRLAQLRLLLGMEDATIH